MAMRGGTGESGHGGRLSVGWLGITWVKIGAMPKRNIHVDTSHMAFKGNEDIEGLWDGVAKQLVVL